MAITETAKSIEFTATSDAKTFFEPQVIVGMTFRGTGLTPDQVLVVTDGVNTISKYQVEAAADNADMWLGMGPKRISAIGLSGTVGGAWTLTVFLR